MQGSAGWFAQERRQIALACVAGMSTMQVGEGTKLDWEKKQTFDVFFGER